PAPPRPPFAPPPPPAIAAPPAPPEGAPPGAMELHEQLHPEVPSTAPAPPAPATGWVSAEPQVPPWPPLPPRAPPPAPDTVPEPPLVHAAEPPPEYTRACGACAYQAALAPTLTVCCDCSVASDASRRPVSVKTMSPTLSMMSRAPRSRVPLASTRSQLLVWSVRSGPTVSAAVTSRQSYVALDPVRVIGVVTAVITGAVQPANRPAVQSSLPGPHELSQGRVKPSTFPSQSSSRLLQ